MTLSVYTKYPYNLILFVVYGMCTTGHSYAYSFIDKYYMILITNLKITYNEQRFKELVWKNITGCMSSFFDNCLLFTSRDFVEKKIRGLLLKFIVSTHPNSLLQNDAMMICIY